MSRLWLVYFYTIPYGSTLITFLDGGVKSLQPKLCLGKVCFHMVGAQRIEL